MERLSRNALEYYRHRLDKDERAKKLWETAMSLMDELEQVKEKLAAAELLIKTLKNKPHNIETMPY